MSLETRIEALTAAVIALTSTLQAAGSAPPVHQQAAPTGPGTPPPFNPAAQQATGAPAGMPGAPFPGGAPATPPPAPAPAGLPFNDVASLVKYATDTYHALEAKQAGRGAWIQQVMTQMGFNSANEIPASHYQAFYQQVENLKAQP